MLSTDLAYLGMNDSLARTIQGKVELYNSSTNLELLVALLGTYTPTGALQSIHVERAGESGKFFGFGVCQKVTIKLVDKDRTITPEKGNVVKLHFSANDSAFIRVCPSFVITNVERDEKTNIITLTGYDKLHAASVLKLSDLGIDGNDTVENILGAIIQTLELDGCFGPTYYLDRKGNYSGVETLRAVLDDIAEMWQRVYFVDIAQEAADSLSAEYEWLYFKPLDIEGEPVLEITNRDYFELTTEPEKTIGGIAHVTELGDNVVAGGGTIQYVRDNGFWTSEEIDVADALSAALSRVEGLTITPFKCVWRGNFVTQFGDKILLKAKDGSDVVTYILNDSFEYNGGFKQTTMWDYEEQEQETATPTNLGETLKQTYARVDKVSKQIDLVASEVDGNTEAIAALIISTDSINASVQRVEEVTNAAIEGINGELATLTSRVDASVTAEDVTIAIQKELADGVDKVTTSTGFTFDENGLTVSKSDSDITTTISEDGMTVYRSGEAVLVADNEGVKAEDLHATTYLVIGKNSRFEDFGSDRTACFWIGGA